MIQERKFFLTLVTCSILVIAATLSVQTATAQSSEGDDGRIVKKLATVTLVDPDRSVPKLKPGTYSYIFEACAGSNPILGPEVIITSDSESKKIKLSNDLKANECQTSVSKIKASSKDQITAVMVERGGVSKIIIDLENKITEIKSKLVEKKKELVAASKTDTKSSDFDMKISDITNEIVKLRKDLNDSREQYHRTVYLLYK